jgi:apolipoprotein N-acyltransferase
VLPPFTRDALVGEVRGYTGATPFVRWGNWPAIVVAILLILFFARRRPSAEK